MFVLAMEAIEGAGYVPGKDIFLGVDVASTHFYNQQRYEIDSEILDRSGMIKTVSRWIGRFPISREASSISS